MCATTSLTDLQASFFLHNIQKTSISVFKEHLMDFFSQKYNYNLGIPTEEHIGKYYLIFFVNNPKVYN
jgi:hypothetical protein